jgi:uncharacterized SAM-dependent methyltransferase
MSPHHQYLDQTLGEKMIAEGHKILYNENNLLMREANFIRKRVAGRRLVNLFDVGHTNGMIVLPIILELLEEESLSKYIPITPNKSLNQHAINNLQSYIALSGLPKIQTEAITHDIEITDFQTEVAQIQDAQENETVNLFVLGSSVLGNYINPLQVLLNTYNTMRDGDYLAIIQGIYRNGSENNWISDYNLIVAGMGNTQAVSKMIDSQATLKVDWDDTEWIHGIKASFLATRPTEFAGVKIEENQEIVVFRSTRFDRFQLERDLYHIGFKLVSLSLDKGQDNAIFFLQK